MQLLAAHQHEIEPSTWSRVLPYVQLPCPLASVLIIPPTVARFDVDSSGAKNSPCGFSAALS